MRLTERSLPILALFAAPAIALQTPHSHLGVQRAWCANVVLPQARAFHVDVAAPAVRVAGVRADIVIVDGVATTTLDVRVQNPTDRDAEAELLLPVPDGAVVSGFDFEGKGADSSAQLLPLDEAKATYDSIVARLKDPALLEFAGTSLVRSSVFPVPRGGMQTVRVRYEHVLPVEGSRWDYELPRSESLAADVQWDVTLEVRSARPIADVYSPTHDLPRVEGSATRVKLHARPGAPMQAGPLRVSVLLADGPVTTTLFTSADPDGDGGWFMLLAGLGEVPADVKLPQREVTLVLDRSGSMAGQKFDQARAAALQVLEGLAFGEAIQIIDYSHTVERFAAAAVIKSPETLPLLRAYLAGLTVGGNTNLDGALAAALAMPPTTGKLPVVLFLTDGLPTEGEVREHVIRARIEQENVHGRRVFTFGVGNDVNAPLLDAVAVTSRARATYVRPEEDVERAVSDVFQDLSGPVVTDLAVAVKDADGNENTRLVRDVYPQVLPDLFRGDRLLLVGRYIAEVPACFELTGTRIGEASRWTLEYDFANALPRNDFVKRLWAMRRIAGLEDELRRVGADPSALASLKDDPRYSELVKEMLDLATRFGVLTDSTAFLALEGTQLGDSASLLLAATDSNLFNVSCRSGLEGVALQQNVALNRDQAWVNGANALYSSAGELVTNPTVQTIQGRTFFRRGTRWVDGTLALAESDAAPDRVVTFGSPEHLALVSSLTAQGCAGQLSLNGEILLRNGAETVLVKPAEVAEAPQDGPQTEPAPQPAASKTQPAADESLQSSVQ
jgi:Ca-activated chloride channel family protein